jgi:hypothetical protein
MTAKSVQSAKRIGISQACVWIGGRRQAAHNWLDAFKHHAANAKLLSEPAVLNPWF